MVDKIFFPVKCDGSTNLEEGFDEINAIFGAFLAMISALSCVQSSAALSSPWQNADIGNVGAAGDSSVTNSIFTLSGAGADIWNTADAFQFASQTLSGDGIIIARIAGLQNTNQWAKAGVMIRETLDANSRWALVAVTPSSGVTFQWRSETGGNCAYSATGGITAPAWVKLVRSGNSFTAYRSADGATWTRIGSPTTLSMTRSVYVGLAVTSHNDPTLCTATFDNVKVGQASKWPTVSVTSPANGSTLTALANVQLTSDASVTDGTLAKVQFFAGSTLLGEASTQPYSISLPPLKVGSYSYTANAITVDGFVSASTPSTITVVHPTSDGDGLSGTYFNNVDLTSLTVSRIDPSVNFVWGNGSPSLLIDPDTFSACWLGRVQPYYSELYTFYTNSDDGVRLWVNHQLLIDNWTNHAPTENSATIQLDAGSTYDIKLEFYENTGGATMQLAWSSPSTPKDIVPQSQLFSTGSDMQIGTGDGLHGDYFNVSDLSTQPVLTRVDSTVNFNWNGAQPDPLVHATGFSTRWTGALQAQYSNAYTLSVVADDGVRVWFNGQLKIDEWINEGTTEYSFTVDLVAGSKYDIVIEYYQNGGGAVAQLFWASPMTPQSIVPQSQLYSTGNVPFTGSGNGLFASYFNTIDLSGGLAPAFNTPALTRVDGTVNFDWGTGSPDPAINPDNFSVRWIGQIEPQFTETYTFYITCDDGARLWINNKLIVDAWTDHAPAEYSGNIELKAGEKAGIKLEYYEHTGGAVAKLAWSSPSRPKITVPQSQLSCTTGLAVPLPTFSVTSPAFIEGSAWSPNGNPVAVTTNGSNSTFISDNDWFTNVPLNADGSVTAISVTQGGTGSVKQGSIVWWPLDIAGSEASDHNIVIRKGDSLLLTANGSGESLAIDVDGDGVFDVTGAPGQVFPTAYNTAGTYLVAATIDGLQVGTLVVTVMDVDLGVSLACAVKYQREKDVIVEPAVQADNIVFCTNDLAQMQVTVKGPFNSEDGSSGTTIYLKPFKRATPMAIARLGSQYGPILAVKELVEYTIDQSNLREAMINSRTQIGGTTLVMRPYAPNVRFSFDVFAHTSTFLAGAKSLSINTSDVDPVTGQPVFVQEYDAASNEVVGVYKLELQVPPTETKYCFRYQAHQKNPTREVNISEVDQVNGDSCIIEGGDYLFVIPEKNDEDTIADKNLAHPKDASLPYTNTQSIECWESSDKTLLYNVKKGMGYPLFYLVIDDFDKLFAQKPTDRLMPSCDVNIPSCADYPGNFHGLDKPSLSPKEVYTVFPFNTDKINANCNNEAYVLETATAGSPRPCDVGCRQDVPYVTGIRYGQEKINVRPTYNHGARFFLFDINLFRVDADGTGGVVGRSAFPDYICPIKKPDNPPFDPETPDPGGCADNPPFPGNRGNLGVPFRVTAFGPPGVSVSIKLEVVNPIRVSLTGLYADSDSLKLFSLTPDASGQKSVTVYLQLPEIPRPRPTGTRTLTVSAKEHSWVCPVAEVCGYKVTDTEKITIVDVDLQVDSDNNGTIDDNDDPIEENSPGAIICLNDNDDNKDGISDLTQHPVPSEKDLKPIKLKIIPSIPNWHVLLRSTAGANKVKFWDTSVKDNEVILPKTYDSDKVPAILYMEGVDLGEAKFELVYIDEQGYEFCKDLVVVTVVKLDLAVDSNNDGTIDDLDELVEEQSPGKIIAYKATYDGPDCLAEMNLSLNPALPAPYTTKLSAITGNNRVKIWLGLDRLTEVTLPQIYTAGNMPATLFIEGVDFGEVKLQLELKSATDYTICKDIVVVTVVKIGLLADSNNNGTIGEEDEPIKMDEPGKVISYNGNDDNKNGIPDRDENGPVTDEKDLAQLNITLTPLINNTTLRIRTTSGGDLVRFWTTSTKAKRVLPADMVYAIGFDSVPSVLYMEGFFPGQETIELIYETQAGEEICRDSIVVNVVRAEVDVYDGQGAAAPVADKIGRGAFTVANLNDTDGNGTVDKDQTAVTPGEKDLFKLVLKQPLPLTVPISIKLAFMGPDTKVWKNSDKSGGEDARRDFDVVGTVWPVTLWVEGRSKSASLRDVEIKVSYKETALDRALSTFVWAEKTDFKNQLADALWADAKDPLKDTYNGTYGGKFGIQYAADPVNVQYAMGMQFTVSPSNIGAEPGVRFDVTRQKEKRSWVIDAGVVAQVDNEYWPGRAAFDLTGPTGADVDRATDDASQSDEDNVPGITNHIYSIDGPGHGNDGAHDQYIRRLNFLEFVRVRFDATAPEGNNTSGSRCSAKVKWHAFMWSEKDGAVYKSVAGKGNEVDEGNKDILPAPAP